MPCSVRYWAVVDGHRAAIISTDTPNFRAVIRA